VNSTGLTSLCTATSVVPSSRRAPSLLTIACAAPGLFPRSDRTRGALHPGPMQTEDMPERPATARALVVSLPSRILARRVILPWILGDERPVGEGLEIGAGSGAMSAALLAVSPTLLSSPPTTTPTWCTRRGKRWLPLAIGPASNESTLASFRLPTAGSTLCCPPPCCITS
jgi:hypothetical protein